MKKLLYIAPLAIGLILSSCGSKDGDKKEEGDDKKKVETGCDCMEIMVAEIKKLEDISKMGELEARLNKEYPDCNKLADELFAKYPGPEEAAKDCPAINEFMQLMSSMQPEPTMPADTLENFDEMEEYEEELEGNE